MATKTSSNMILAVAWRRYLELLSTDPVMTKSISAGVLSVVSDLVAKGLGKEKIKTSSLFNELTMGLIIRGPIIHYFHTFLDKVVFAKVKNQSSVGVVIGKVLLDQFVFSPFFVALYFWVNGLMNDTPDADIRKQIQTTLFGVMKKNWAVWIPANAIAYAVVPLNLRVLYGNIINIFWTAYLITQIAGKSSKAKARVEEVNGSHSS